MDTNRSAAFELPMSRPHACGCVRRAFTLLELLVVLATVGVLTALLLPALAGTQPKTTKAFQCLNNMRQLTLAWTLYAGDYHDRLAINSDPHVNGSMSYNGSPSWVSGSLDWTTSQANTNTAYLVGALSLLGNYVGKSPQVFACPATACFVSPSQRLAGWTGRCRSVAMNAAIGDGYKYTTSGRPFGWTNWYYAKKMTDFHTPAPSGVWVFSDEHPDSIDDGMMYTPSYPTTIFVELPGCQHDNGCGMSFADGRAEIHRWKGLLASQLVKLTQPPVTVACPRDDQDMLFMSSRTPQN